MNQKYVILFPDYPPSFRALRVLVDILQDVLRCDVVGNLNDVPSNLRPIVLGAHVSAIRNSWGKLRDDAIIYETEQHAYWFSQEYLDWLKNYTVWSVFKGTVLFSLH